MRVYLVEDGGRSVWLFHTACYGMPRNPYMRCCFTLALFWLAPARFRALFSRRFFVAVPTDMFLGKCNGSDECARERAVVPLHPSCGVHSKFVSITTIHPVVLLLQFLLSRVTRMVHLREEIYVSHQKSFLILIRIFSKFWLESFRCSYQNLFRHFIRILPGFSLKSLRLSSESLQDSHHNPLEILTKIL